MTWDHPNPYTQPVTPRSPDIDGLGHTNNAVYVQWCEKVAWAHSEALGLGLAEYHSLDRAMAIRHAQYDYLLPTAPGEALTIGTWLLTSDGRLTMQRGFQLVRDRDAATVLRGRWDLVCIDIAQGRPRRMPPEFVRVYSAALIAVSPPTPG